MSAPLVELSGITVDYSGVRALDEVSLSVRPGEIVSLLGKNGAGKSTLIKVMAGLQRADAGSYAIDGEPVARHTPTAIKSAGLHFIFQELEEFSHLTVAENVLLAAGLPKRAGLVNERALERRAEKLLERIGCDVKPGRAMNELSTIERRLVMVARALAGDVRMLVLDEPTASLSPREVDRILGLCTSLRDNGTAIVYVSHRLEEVLAITDRAVILRDGREVHAAPGAELTMDVLVNHISGPSASRSSTRSPNSALATPTEPLLEVRSLGDGSRFTDVSFDVHPGEIVGIGGLVGAGRTELVSCIAGARRATSGELVVRGRTVTHHSIRAALANGVVMLSEERRSQGLIGKYSVTQNTTIAKLSNYRVKRWLPLLSPRRERRAAAGYAQEMQMRIAGLNQAVETLSGGTQQKVLAARALTTGSDVIIMDEPTAGIDVGAKQEIYALLNRLASEGRGIILVSSEFAELVEVCDKVVVLALGRQTGELSGESLTDTELTRRSFQFAPVAGGQARTGRSL